MYEEDLALNNLQWLICYKTQPNQNQNLQNIPADFSHVPFRMVSILLISSSSILSSSFLRPVPIAPTKSGITVTFIFHYFFSSLTKCTYLFRFSCSFTFAE